MTSIVVFLLGQALISLGCNLKSVPLVYKPWQLETFLVWHRSDPVSDFERARNDEAFLFQGNRNPFIDNPCWVEMIWGELVSSDAFKPCSGSIQN
ncbi:endonuclease [Endozoicomonas numazuensis]|uniref:endonuclease n=1 Tax=Endozoicomonas numazuensis TaxID=1137799 RepID=UPI001378CB32|nr:endonuclease [Endozoicomonas numazuensis]